MSEENKVLIEQEGDHGGDVIFQVGAGRTDGGDPAPACDGSFIWRDAMGTDRLRIDPDGLFFVNGELVEDDHHIYDGFKAWLKTATIHR